MAELQHGADEAGGIAIIGMAGRFPGAADLNQYWANLRDGVETVCFFDEDEMLAAGVPASAFGNPRYVRAGYRSEGIDLFDAEFFGYSPHDAMIMDPQHRIFLESAWAAVEHAGYDTARYPGIVGVFAGAGTSAYLRHVFSNLEHGAAIGAANVGLGNELGYLTSRVSYKLDLRGPSFPVHTACSTSLVAIHYAGQSLLGYECDMAIAGGVAFRASPGVGYMYQEEGILSPDGHCRPFDAAATGTLFGNGVGVVVLKRLADALADHDTIYAVVKGSAVNNDGAGKASFTAPSIAGQASVISDALASAGVDPQTISYIEAHGTGTRIGDSIEVQALIRALPRPDDGARRRLGSVKSNIGHLDAAAGIAGLLKTVLALQHELLPPTLHMRQANPDIDFDQAGLEVVREPLAWPRSDHAPRRAGVSSFGFGGTNAHVIVEEAPTTPPSTSARPSQLVLLSARAAGALDQLSARLAAHLRDHGPDLADVSYTLAQGRRVFAHRRIVVAPDALSAAAALESKDPSRTIDTVVPAMAEPRRVAFLFTGQGSQYPHMASALYQHEPVVRHWVDVCADELRPHLARDLREVLFPADDSTPVLTETRWAQPALFTIEYALVQLWRSWGVAPAAMLGHGVGELVAACVAGVFTRPDALALVALRGRLMHEQPGGAMVSVAADRSTVDCMLTDGVSLAAHNGTKDCVVAGGPAALARFVAVADEAGIMTYPVATSHAFHSALMEPVIDPFAAAVRRVARQAPGIPFVSNITGTWITEEQATDPRYWGRHVRAGVEFASGLDTLAEDAELILLEVGPGQTLASLARRRAAVSSGRMILSSLPHQRLSADALTGVQRCLGQLWLGGVSPDWTGYFSPERRQRVGLPTYPFEGKRFWLEEVAAPAAPASTVDHPHVDDLLIRTMGEAIFRTSFSLERHWVLSEHRMMGEAIVPGTTYVDLATAVGRLYFGAPVTEVRAVEFLQPLLVKANQPRPVHLSVREVSPREAEFTVVSVPDGDAPTRDWIVHARCVVDVGPTDGPVPVDLAEVADHCGLATVDVGRRQAEHDVMEFGQRWQRSLDEVRIGVRVATGRLTLPDEFAAECAAHTLHPALLDLATGFAGFAMYDEGTDRAEVGANHDFFLPIAYDRIVVHQPIPARSISIIRPSSDVLPTQEVRKADVRLVDLDGQPVLDIEGFTAKRVRNPQSTIRQLAATARHHELRWRLEPAVPVVGPDGAVLMITDNEALSGRLLPGLRAAGTTVVAARLADEFVECGRDEFLVPPTEDGFVQLLNALSGRRPEHTVYLVDASESITDTEVLLDRGVYGLFGLARAWGTTGWTPGALTVIAPSVHVVTGKENPSPAHAALFGLTKVIGHENSGMACRTLDVDPDVSVDVLRADLHAAQASSLVALRGDQRYVAEMAEAVLPESADTGLPAGAWLITGGLGGLGLAVAGHLAREQPGVELVLVGRTPAPVREQWEDVSADGSTKAIAQVKALRALEELGATVRCFAADVASIADVQRVVGQARAEFGRIAGVVHAAGMAGDGFILRKDRATFAATLAPKVAGTLALELATSADPPELMVLFGSTTAVFGAAGQSDYTAANMFLDSFAEYRNRQGRRTVSIDWTDWLETGMAFDHGVAADQGFFRSVTVDDGLDSFGQIVRSGRERVIVGEINYAGLARLAPRVVGDLLRRSPVVFAPAIRRQLDTTARQQPARVVVRPGAEVIPLGRDNGAYSETERRIAQVWGQELGVAELNIFASSFDLGADSMTTLRIAGAIQSSLGRRVTMVELFRYVTVADLASYLDRTAG